MTIIDDRYNRTDGILLLHLGSQNDTFGVAFVSDCRNCECEFLFLIISRADKSL